MVLSLGFSSALIHSITKSPLTGQLKGVIGKPIVGIVKYMDTTLEIGLRVCIISELWLWSWI